MEITSELFCILIGFLIGLFTINFVKRELKFKIYIDLVQVIKDIERLKND